MRRVGRALVLLAGAAALLGAAAVARADRVHVVRPGESLWRIAAKATGDPTLWPLLYRANRDQIKDPSRIYPSQRLQIPMHVDESARRSARLEASEHAAGQRLEETP